MRPIKLRAWDEDTKQMTEGLPLKEICGLRLLHGGEVRPSVTFLQFTGLKDKNRKEIYEGDVVCACYKNSFKSFECHNGEVEWIDHIGAWGVRIAAILTKESEDKWEKNDFEIWGIDKFNYEHGLELEIIGNIYGNPELLN